MQSRAASLSPQKLLSYKNATCQNRNSKRCSPPPKSATPYRISSNLLEILQNQPFDHQAKRRSSISGSIVSRIPLSKNDILHKVIYKILRVRLRQNHINPHPSYSRLNRQNLRSNPTRDTKPKPRHSNTQNSQTPQNQPCPLHPNPLPHHPQASTRFCRHAPIPASLLRLNAQMRHIFAGISAAA